MSEEQKKQHAHAQPVAPAPDLERIRQFESLLCESEERHALLAECIKDFALFALDLEGCVIWWGEGTKRLVGYEKDEIQGKHFSVLFTPEDRDRGLPERELETAAASGSAVSENWVVRKNGQLFWGNGFTAARRGEGDLTGYVKILRDRTERWGAHEALRESELRLRVALTAADIGTWLWQVPADKQILDGNLQCLMGVPEGRSVTSLEDFLSYIHEHDRDAVREAFLRSGRDGCPLSMEYQVARPDRPVSWFRSKGEVFRDEQGRILYLAGACVDITKHRAMDEELRRSRDELENRVRERTALLERTQERVLQAERLAAIGQTVTALAHEGRNSLQRAHACLSLLAMRQAARPEELGLTKRAQAALDELARLFDDIRFYAAPVRLAYNPCDLAQVWREGWGGLADQRGQRDARLVEEEAPSSLACQADPLRLRQVFLNLFANSLEACPDPIVVRLSCTEASLAGRPALRVSVHDN